MKLRASGGWKSGSVSSIIRRLSTGPIIFVKVPPWTMDLPHYYINCHSTCVYPVKLQAKEKYLTQGIICHYPAPSLVAVATGWYSTRNSNCYTQ